MADENGQDDGANKELPSEEQVQAFVTQIAQMAEFVGGLNLDLVAQGLRQMAEGTAAEDEKAGAHFEKMARFVNALGPAQVVAQEMAEDVAAAAEGPETDTAR